MSTFEEARKQADAAYLTEWRAAQELPTLAEASAAAYAAQRRRTAVHQDSYAAEAAARAVMSEEITWSLVRDLRADDVVRLNYSGASHYFAIDTAPEPTGRLLVNTCRDGMPEVEFWQTPVDREMTAIGESALQAANGLARVQVLMPRPKEQAS